MLVDDDKDDQAVFGMTVADAMGQFNDQIEKQSKQKSSILRQKKETNFYLIRHAEAELNLVDIVGGRSNHSPLTSRGVEQAKNLAQRVSKIYYLGTEVYSSPAVRCIQTLLHSLGEVRFEINPFLQELDQGQWVGLPRKEVYSDEVKAEIAKDPWNFKALGGESQYEVALRVKNVLHDIAKRNEKDNIIYTHGGAIKYLCAELFNWDKKETWKVPVENCSITHLKYSENRFELVEFNSLK